jgi:transposase-like protein
MKNMEKKKLPASQQLEMFAINEISDIGMWCPNCKSTDVLQYWDEEEDADTEDLKEVEKYKCYECGFTWNVE